MEDRHFASLYPAATREHDMGKVVSYILAGNASEVIGIPGIGRTLFLSLLAYNKHVRVARFGEKATQYHFVLIDFTSFKGLSLAAVGRSMLFTLIESLEDREMTTEAKYVKKILDEHKDTEDDAIVFHGIKRAIEQVAHVTNGAVVFLLDAFEVYAPHVVPRFFTHITSLRDHMRYGVSFVFSLNRPLASVVDREVVGEVERLIAGHTLWLALSDEVGNDFLRQFLEKQFNTTIPDALYEKALHDTGGLAKLVKVVLEELLQEKEGEETYAAFIAENRAVRVLLAEIWESLHADEQQLVRSAAEGKVVVETSGRAYLSSTQLLSVKNDITIPLFHKFVRTLGHDMTHGPYLYREDANDIVKGEMVISENFTAAEFRLFSYLLRHQGEVVSRDALVAAAWSDAKSTAGVSEQALDQLLYRLRQKIEENPALPQHLLTIKGRGVKFMP